MTLGLHDLVTMEYLIVEEYDARLGLMDLSSLLELPGDHEGLHLLADAFY